MTVACQAPLWDSPDKNTGVACHFLLQEIFPTGESNPGFPHCRQILYRLSCMGSLCLYLYLCICILMYMCVYTHSYTHIYNIYEHLVFLSLVKGYLDCLHLLVLESNSAMNMDIDIPTWVPAFNSLVYVARNRIIGSYDNSVHNSLSSHHIVIHNDLPFFTILPTMLNGSIFPHLCQQLLLSALFVITIIVYNT